MSIIPFIPTIRQGKILSSSEENGRSTALPTASLFVPAVVLILAVATPSFAQNYCIRYGRLASDAMLGLGVYDSSDHLVRTFYDSPTGANGCHEWDGKDQKDHELPGRGPFKWKLIQNPGRLKTEYLFSLLSDWPNGSCVGEEGLDSGPRSVAVDGTGFYIGAGGGEGGPQALKLDPDGNSVLWRAGRIGADRGYFSMGVIEQTNQIYVLSQGGQISYFNRNAREEPSREGDPCDTDLNTGCDGRPPVLGNGIPRLEARDILHPEEVCEVPNAVSQPIITCIDAAPATVWQRARSTPLSWSRQQSCPGGVCMVEQSMDLAAYGTNDGSRQLVVSYRDEGKVVWFNPEAHGVYDGTNAFCAVGGGRKWCERNPDKPCWVLHEEDVPQAKGVAIDNQGNVLVISGPHVDDRGKRISNRILRFRLTWGAGRKVTHVSRKTVYPQDSQPTDLLVEPFRLDVIRKDAKTPCTGDQSPLKLGEILVADRGESQQVKRFCPDGTPLDPVHNVGTPGGRKDGPYDPASFVNILDIAADEHGGFYAVEGADNWKLDDPPKHAGMSRVSYFGPNGQFRRQWFGGWKLFAEPDPDDPSIVWVNTPEQYLLKLRVRYDFDDAWWWSCPLNGIRRGLCAVLPRSGNNDSWLCPHWKLEEAYFLPRFKAPNPRDTQPLLHWGPWQREKFGSDVWRLRRHEAGTYFMRDRTAYGPEVLKLDTDAPAEPALRDCTDQSAARAGAWMHLANENTRDMSVTYFDAYSFHRLEPTSWDEAGCPRYGAQPKTIATLDHAEAERFISANNSIVPYYSATDGLLVGATYLRADSAGAGCQRVRYDAVTQGCITLGCPVPDEGTQFHHCNPCRYWTLMKYPVRASECDPSRRDCEETIWRIGDERTTGGETSVCDLDCHLYPNRVVGWFFASIGSVRLGSSDNAPSAFLLIDHNGSSCDNPSGKQWREGRAVVYAWSADGLWLGDLFQNRDDMSPRGVWKYGLTGDNSAGAIHQDPNTRDILYFGGGISQVKVYRITGLRDVVWDAGEVQECPGCP